MSEISCVRMLTRPNLLAPRQLTAVERISEVAEILARGLIRLRARKSSPLSADRGDSFLDFPAAQRGHVADTNVGDVD